MPTKRLPPKPEKLFFDNDILPAPFMAGVRASSYEDALRHAACQGNVTAVLFLLNHGVDVNASNFMRHTALMLAAMNGQSDIVQFLIEAGADVDLQDIFFFSLR